MSFEKITTLNFLSAPRTETILYKFVLAEFEVTISRRLEDIVGSRLSEWLRSEKGKWCYDNATEIQLIQGYQDYNRTTITCAITGKLTEKQLTYFNLKFS